jgi:hypothetical protein
MVRRPFRTSRSLLVSLGLLVVVALILGVVAVGRGVWSDPRSVTEDSTTSSTEAPTTSPGGPPPTTRSPGPVARIIQWLNAYAPLAGGAGGAEDEAFSRLLAGECQGVLTLSEATTPGDRLAEPARSLYEGAASACLAAFEGRRELWPRAEAAYARLGGQTGRLACETRTVYPLLQRILEAHHADPNVRLVKRSGGRGVLRCPRFTKITPNHGPAAGGYQVRIEGQHLPPVVGVNIDFDLRVEAARQDGQQVVITMPPAPPNVNPEELVTIWPDDAPIYELGAAVDFSYDPPAGTTSTATTASSTTSTTQPASTTSSTTPAPPSS